jgi:hypothetical protein
MVVALKLIQGLFVFNRSVVIEKIAGQARNDMWFQTTSDAF